MMSTRCRDSATSPKHLIDADPQFPFVVAGFTEEQHKGFANVGLRAARIGAVKAKKRCHRHALAVRILKIQLGMEHHAGRVRGLAGIQRRLREHPGLDPDPAGDLLVGEIGFCLSLSSRQCNAAARCGPDGGPKERPGRHQRARLRLVCVKSLSSRPFELVADQFSTCSSQQVIDHFILPANQ